MGTLNVIRSIISDNNTFFDAGGIFNDVGGNVLIENSTIAHNATQGNGGILNIGSLVIRNSAIIANSNGCCEGGAGIGNSGFLEIVNSTIAKNSAGSGGGGGGIQNAGVLSITNSTIRENEVRECQSLPCTQGGGIKNNFGTVLVQNTIIAGNSVNSPFATGPDCGGTITSVGNNLVGDPSGCDINLQPTDLTGDPGLGSLVGDEEDALPGQAYYPVLAGSPVIDKGNPNVCPQVDQLENPRVGICDIGSIEFRGPVTVSVDVSPRSDRNLINPNSNKNINVAIFSLGGFDATEVDPKTVLFGASGTEAAPIHVAIRDVDGNGSRDVILRFQIPDTGIKCGDTAATLTGQTFSGISFIGSSPIKTVQCGKQR
jgi:hypothetical protein